MHVMLVCLGHLSKYQPAHPARERPSKSRVEYLQLRVNASVEIVG